MNESAFSFYSIPEYTNIDLVNEMFVPLNKSNFMFQSPLSLNV